MSTEKIKFDISLRTQIEDGEYKVVTLDNREATIISWDADPDWPIVAMVDRMPRLYREDGTYYEPTDECFDLHLESLKPESKLDSEFEKWLLKFIKSIGNISEIYDDEEIISWIKEEEQNIMKAIWSDEISKISNNTSLIIDNIPFSEKFIDALKHVIFQAMNAKVDDFDYLLKLKSVELIKIAKDELKVWTPTERQIEALDAAIEYIPESVMLEELIELRSNLKTLTK